MQPELQVLSQIAVPRIYRRDLVENETFVRLCASRDWLAENHGRRVALAEAADQAGFSPFHFQRLFVRAFGETPLQFMTRIRLERAKKILRTGVDPVTEICMDLGYESMGSFSSLFRREVGLAPSHFRRVFAMPGLWELKATPSCFRRFR
jgi:AraC-like DNA-binding protein